ncbi:MAG: DUF3006 domain-containing protein [Oscillospiraceae bacterium]|nr:DUF3006 domain-containing protein [Oscillospiraceae bacterium]
MLIIDRIEQETAAAETETGMRNIPLAALPVGVREGDVLRETNAGYIIDRALTEQRRTAAAEKLRRLKHE